MTSAGRVLSRWTWANWDKPHRCPKCHGIQYDSDNPVMRCDRCHLRWSRSQARLRLNWYRWTGR